MGAKVAKGAGVATRSPWNKGVDPGRGVDRGATPLRLTVLDTLAGSGK